MHVKAQPISQSWLHVPADTQHGFTLSNNDWGFNQLIPQNRMTEAEGFLVNDTLVFEVYIRLHAFEKKEIGYMGLRSQGDTCTNSLLQTLFNLKYFRKVDSCCSSRRHMSSSPQSATCTLQYLFCPGDMTVSCDHSFATFLANRGKAHPCLVVVACL